MITQNSYISSRNYRLKTSEAAAAGMACNSHFLLLTLIVTFSFASARSPPMVDNHKASVPRGRPIQELQDEKTDIYGKGKLKPDSTSSDSVAAYGLIPTIPGGDGSFHFDLGPIGFGGNIGWGGYAPPPYSRPQPYVIVSPYASPYFTSSPYQPPVTAYGQPSQGYYSPVPGYGQPAPVWGYGQPSQGYYGPYSSARANTSPIQYDQPSQGHSGPYASAPEIAPTPSQVGG